MNTNIMQTISNKFRHDILHFMQRETLYLSVQIVIKMWLTHFLEMPIQCRVYLLDGHNAFSWSQGDSDCIHDRSS